MNFKIADFKVVNKVANTLSIDVNSTVFDGKVSGNISLLNVVDTSIDGIPTPMHMLYGSIYSEQFTLEVTPTDDIPSLVKKAAAQQLGVTYL
ncbi:MAG: hypothetical protein WCP46_00060 [Alphaproteobacteria bacterium]